jgi:large subunit ribosomal protein L7/L12
VFLKWRWVNVASEFSKGNKMANITKEQVIEWLSEQSVLEIASLIKDLEAKWGVSAAAPIAAVAAVAPSAASSDNLAAEEKTDFEVVLKATGDKKIEVIKVIRSLVGLTLKDAKDLAEGAPKSVKADVPKAEAEEMKKQLEAAGATVELK